MIQNPGEHDNYNGDVRTSPISEQRFAAAGRTFSVIVISAVTPCGMHSLIYRHISCYTKWGRTPSSIGTSAVTQCGMHHHFYRHISLYTPSSVGTSAVTQSETHSVFYRHISCYTMLFILPVLLAHPLLDNVVRTPSSSGTSAVIKYSPHSLLYWHILCYTMWSTLPLLSARQPLHNTVRTPHFQSPEGFRRTVPRFRHRYKAKRTPPRHCRALVTLHRRQSVE